MKKGPLELHIVCRWSFPDSSGGVAMHNHNLVKVIRKNNQCSVVSLESKSNKSYFEKIGIDYIGIIPNDNYNKNHLLIPFFLKNIARHFSDNHISKKFRKKLDDKNGLIEFMDIHSEGYHFLKQNVKKRSNVIIRSHTPFSILKNFFSKNELKGVNNPFAFKREKKCFEMAGQITTPSQDLKNQIVNLFELNPDKIDVLPNIIDTSHFRPIEKKRNRNFTILHVGRFERSKGVETLIKSFIEISKEFRDINLINIGEKRGSSINVCHNLLIDNNLSDRVTFKGFVEYNELPDFYSLSDIVVVPSEIYESFSYTVAQGMACGKTVIASNIGGIPETVNYGKAGVLFEPGNFRDLTDKIKSVLSNKEKRKYISKKAREHVMINYSMEVLGPKYERYYKSLMS